MSALGLALLLALGGAGVEEEHAEVQERLDAEKAALDALTQEKQSLLTLLDTLERLARESSQRALELERSVARLNQQKAQVGREAEVAQAALWEQQEKLAPRLLTLYRMQKRDALGQLLSAADFATLIKRQRAVKTLVASDAQALEELALVSRYQAQQARRLERLDATAQRYLKALRSEQAVSRARLARFDELVRVVNAEQNQKGRVIAELEANERELAALVSELETQSTASGLRARKGKLPWPSGGMVEVGFGKVVNPRFNTVTVQKGVDIRAPLGSPVLAAGAGTVAFSNWLKGYGNLVIIDHGAGYHSLYAHLAIAEVEPGAQVEEGEELGKVGDTGSLKGAFLYFEIRKQGQAIDPLPWLEPAER